MLTAHHFRNFNDAYPRLVTELRERGHDANPRGTTTRELTSVVVQIENPTQHLVSSWGRPINVAFALAEVLWILAGRRDVEMLEFYNSNIRQFSDDGQVFNAPYGHRLRYAFGHDQIEDVVRILSNDPDSRQAVMSIWHPAFDRGWEEMEHMDYGVTPRRTKDRACNLMSMLLVREEKLHWTQIQRSNDIIWGTPYNWMQFSHLQRWIAGLLGVEVGTFTHHIQSLHYYRGEGAYYDGDHEVSKVSGFNAYMHRQRPEQAWPAPSTDLLDEIMHYEAEIRDGEHSVKIPTHLGYWHDVLKVLKAHAYYKLDSYDGDGIAAHILGQESGPVYGPAQARFYMAHRWGKGGQIQRLMDIGGFEISCRPWITEGAKK